jgi:hypothetical protein
MIRGQPVIVERVGNYYVQECDEFYRAYSGYTYIVCHQPPTLCRPKQLAGFPAGGRDQAIEHMRVLAVRGVEDRRFAGTKRRIEARIKAGEMPCPHDDNALAMQLMKDGYRMVRSDRAYRWFARPKPPKKPQPTLFDGTPGR